MMVGWGDIDTTGLDDFAVDGVVGAKGAAGVERLGELALLCRPSVQHDEDGCIEGLRKPGQEPAKRRQRTRGSSSASTARSSCSW